MGGPQRELWREAWGLGGQASSGQDLRGSPLPSGQASLSGHPRDGAAMETQCVDWEMKEDRAVTMAAAGSANHAWPFPPTLSQMQP